MRSMTLERYAETGSPGDCSGTEGLSATVILQDKKRGKRIGL